MFKISGHVNYNLPIIKQMQNSFVTGLKLKNSLTNELVPVSRVICRKNLYLSRGRMLRGILVVQLSTRIVIWDMHETTSVMI